MNFNATFIVSIISFIAFVFIMNKILYKPILNILEKRRKYFQDNTDTILNNSKKTDEILKKRDEKISLAHKNSKDITTGGLKNAKAKKDEIINSVKSSAEEKTAGALQEIIKEKENVANDLENKSAELSDLIVSKFFGAGKND